jgi:AraC-like DNA-binding protein
MLNVQFVFLKAEGVFPSFREIAGESPLFRSFLELGKSYALLKDSDEVYTSLKSLVIELSGGREESGLIVNSLMLQLLLQLSRLTLEAENRRLDAGDIYVKKAIQYMQHHYDCDIKTADIAAEINIHPVYLHRIFKERTNSTIIEYLTRLRLEKAQALLANTDIPIIEISNYVGMNSRQYFSYMFKKHTGMTPAGYRKTIDKSVVDALNRGSETAG